MPLQSIVFSFKQNRRCLTLNRTVTQHVMRMLLWNLQCRVGLEYLHDLRRRSGCGAHVFGIWARTV